MNRWQAVVFDLDDTLYAERDYVLSGFRAVAQWADSHLGISAERGFEELRALFEQGVRGDTFNRWLVRHGHNPEPVIPDLVEVYRGHTPKLRPFSGIPELLAQMQQSVRIGLVSDGYLEVQQKKFTALGLGRYFDAVVFSDTWGREAWKPSEIPFRAALAQLSVDPAAAIYVGDNPKKDFFGARRLGMTTIRLCLPGGEYISQDPPSFAHQPHVTVDSISALATMLVAGPSSSPSIAISR